MAGTSVSKFSFTENDLARYPSRVSELEDILKLCNKRVDNLRKNIAAGLNIAQNNQVLQIALKGKAACEEKLRRVLSSEKEEANEYDVDHSEIVEIRKQSASKNRITGIRKRNSIVRTTPLPDDLPYLNDGEAATLICISYIILCDRALHTKSDDLSCLIYVGQIASELDASKRTIRRHIAKLEDLGLIERIATYRPSGVGSRVENDGNILCVPETVMKHFKKVRHLKKQVADFLKGYGQESPTHKEPNKFVSYSTTKDSAELEEFPVVETLETGSQEALNEKQVEPSVFELKAEDEDQLARKTLEQMGHRVNSKDFDAVRQAVERLRKEHFPALDDSLWRSHRSKHGRKADLALLWTLRAIEIRKREGPESRLPYIYNRTGYLLAMLRKSASELRPDVSLGLLLRASKEKLPPSVRLRMHNWLTQNPVGEN